MIVSYRNILSSILVFISEKISLLLRSMLLLIGLLVCTPILNGESKIQEKKRINVLKKLRINDEPLYNTAKSIALSMAKRIDNPDDDTDETPQSNSLSSKIKTWYTDFLYKIPIVNHFMLHKELTKETIDAPQDLVDRMRSIIRSMGVKNPQQYQLKILPDDDNYDAFTITWVRNKTVYITEDFLKLNSPELVDSIIGHECAHLIHDHPIKRVFVALGIYGGFSVVCNRIQQYIPSLQKLSPTTAFIAKSCEEIIKIFCIYKLLYPMYWRHREKQADLHSARALGCARGGISCFSAYCFFPHEDDIWHPSAAKRLSYLSKWEQKHCKLHAHTNSSTKVKNRKLF